MPGRGQSWKEGGHVDSTIISEDVKDQSLQAEDLSVFKSTEITGTGSEQSIAHGLSRTPTLVWWSITLQGDLDTIVEGIHDSTDVKLNFPTSTKLKVFAL